MSALAQFDANIVAADQLVAMYRELRRSRNLGARGQLSAANTDLLWLPRSAVVAAISALDAYVHQVLYDRIPRVLSTPPIPIALADVLAGIFTIKNGNDFQSALPILASHTSANDIFVSYRTQKLEFASYQAPEKIDGAYRLIGHADIFGEVAAIWPGPNSTAADIRRTLAHYTKRRNQIAHEGDRETSGVPRPMQPDYAVMCKDFVVALVSRLNRVEYGN
jgi:hypothetical protein